MRTRAATSRLPSSSRSRSRWRKVAPFEPARYRRATPLAKGETRERNADLDPQIIWRGVRITLSQAERKQLQETGEVELGDAQLVWRGKDTQDWSDLVVNPPPIYIQEKVQPKAIIEGIRKESRARAEATVDVPDLFGDFNGLDDPEARLEFYQHDQHWSNRMILGDSMQVMASLAEREGAARQGAVHLFRSALRHQVQQQLAGQHAESRRKGR